MRRRGFLLISVLLLLAMLLVLCGAYLRSQQHYYRAARSLAWKAAARQLALPGLEDVRVKLLKDRSFPPVDLTANRLTYTERVRDESGALLGTYRITLQSEHQEEPFQVLYVQSEGRLGPPEQPVSTHTVTALCDTRLLRRDASNTPNPDLFRWVQLRHVDWKESP